MRTPVALLKFTAKALINYVSFGIGGDLCIEVLPEVARDIWTWWAGERSEQQLLTELQELAQAPVGDVWPHVNQIVQELAGERPPEVRQMLAAYLAQVPVMIRRSLRRPSDPGGTTIPAGLVLRKGEDLVRFLPTRLPRFKSGDFPLSGLDWQLDELLGIGGFGEVWKAHNPRLPSKPPVALKFCLDQKAARALDNEAKLLDRVSQQCTHPGIVRLLETYLRADPPCLAYEYIEGGDLSGLIQEWHHGRGPSPGQAAKVMLRLTEIVGYVHQLSPPIVHRDLKPANILIQTGGKEGKRSLKIADFGIGGVAASASLRLSQDAKTRHSQTLATVSQGSYTLLYASPQQIAGQPPDVRDDVYALGVIWYQLLTGELNSGAPSGLRWMQALKQRGMNNNQLKLLASCFEALPEHRPADAVQLGERLQALFFQEKPSTKPLLVKPLEPPPELVSDAILVKPLTPGAEPRDGSKGQAPEVIPVEAAQPREERPPRQPKAGFRRAVIALLLLVGLLVIIPGALIAYIAYHPFGATNDAYRRNDTGRTSWRVRVETKSPKGEEGPNLPPAGNTPPVVSPPNTGFPGPGGGGIEPPGARARNQPPTLVLTGLHGKPKPRTFRFPGTITYSPDSQYVAAGCSRLEKTEGLQTRYVEPGVVAIWDTKTGTNRYKKETKDKETFYDVRRIIFGDNSDTLWVSLEASAFLQLRLGGWRLNWKRDEFTRAPGSLLCKTADGKNLLTANVYGVGLYTATDPSKYIGSIYRPIKEKKSVVSAKCDPNGKFVAVGYTDTLTKGVMSDVIFYNLNSKKMITSFELEKELVLRGMALDNRGRRLAVLSSIYRSLKDSRTVHVWNIANRTIEKIFSTQTTGFTDGAIHFHPDGNRIALIGDKGIIQFWDVRSATITATFDPQNSRKPEVLDISPDGAYLGAVCRSGEVLLWRLR